MRKILVTLFLATSLLLRAEPAERFTVTVRGHGPDVLLIPGLACSSSVWNPTADHFDGHYRMHLIQVAGFAGTPAQGNATGPVLQPLVKSSTPTLNPTN
jgi:pimeloyl-ACP methyl ester carboxylesterase